MIGLYYHNVEDSSNPFTKCPVVASYAASPNHRAACVYFALEGVSKTPTIQCTLLSMHSALRSTGSVVWQQSAMHKKKALSRYSEGAFLPSKNLCMLQKKKSGTYNHTLSFQQFAQKQPHVFLSFLNIDLKKYISYPFMQGSWVEM